jgi:hypothetical protein
MSKKRPLNLTLQPQIIAWAKRIMVKRHYTSMSILIEELIRARYDQLFGSGQKPPKSSSSTSGSAADGLEQQQMKKPKAA